MKGKGQTVMVGTKLEEFEAEVLGVMRDVSPGRDMVLCRLKGCNLEHAGIIQGMSGSPIYIDGKLLGAVAFAWEFAKDPIAGVTPFSQMVQYVRSNDRRIAAESKDQARTGGRFQAAAAGRFSPWIEGLAGDEPGPGDLHAADAGLGRGDGRHDADRHAAGRLGLQPAGTLACWPIGSGRSGWRRWPAGRRRNGSSARRATARWSRARR